MSCNRAHDLVGHVMYTAIRMVDFTVAILGVVRVRKQLMMHNETVCLDLDNVTMIPECNFRFNLSFDIALFRKLLKEACQRSKRAINELRICRMKRPYDIIPVQPILSEKFVILTQKISELKQQIENEGVVERNELREFKEISIMFAQLHTDVNMLICNLTNSIRLKDTVLFAAPVTDIMAVLSSVLIKLECLSERIAKEMEKPVLPPRCNQQSESDANNQPIDEIRNSESALYAKYQSDDDSEDVSESTSTESTLTKESTTELGSSIADIQSKHNDKINKTKEKYNKESLINQKGNVNKKIQHKLNEKGKSLDAKNANQVKRHVGKECPVEYSSESMTKLMRSLTANCSDDTNIIRDKRTKSSLRLFNSGDNIRIIKLIQPDQRVNNQESLDDYSKQQIAANQNFSKYPKTWWSSESSLNPGNISQFSREFSESDINYRNHHTARHYTHHLSTFEYKSKRLS
ncbi:hypothetical protein GJ496_000667 [Pomphorhynchus laevis]|nr:hypothetical protein GJ496_000667 [Pomphorhynchus laevis]